MECQQSLYIKNKKQTLKQASRNIDAFFELLRAGLWGEIDTNVHASLNYNSFENVDWNEVYQLAQEQSVPGLVLQGIEWFKNQNDNPNLNVNIPQVLLLQWIGEVQIIEQRNKKMNVFIADLVENLRKHDIYALLVKGQGIAQCYEKPLWRCSGDIDFFLSDDNYQKAKSFLTPFASSVEEEYVREKHLGMTIDGWIVELHGHLYSGLSYRVERELDKLQEDTFYGGLVRSWNNNGVQIFQLGVENDVFYVFTHILQHFYKEGVGLRQICDWCRLMWTYRDKIDVQKLKSRLERAGIMSEWKAFYALASKYLGMPDLVNGFGIMVHDSRYDKKADRIMEFVLMSGNFGHNRDHSYFEKYPYLVRKCVSFGRRVGDLINHAGIFPLDSFRFFPSIMFNGVRSAMRGE